MFEADNQQYAVAYIVFSSVGGSILGPIVGGFVEQFLAWRWNIWIQLIFGGAVQIAHFFLVPETRSTIMMDRIAKKRRKSGENPNIYGPNELEPFKERFSARETITIWLRPFRMFVTEPIVLVLSLLSGFSDALIFMFIQSFALVYELWDFATFAVGLSFIGIGVGYTIAWISFIPAIKRNIKKRAKFPDDERVQYEDRLWWLLWTAPCLPIGLIIFAVSATQHRRTELVLCGSVLVESWQISQCLLPIYQLRLIDHLKSFTDTLNSGHRLVLRCTGLDP